MEGTQELEAPIPGIDDPIRGKYRQIANDIVNSIEASEFARRPREFFHYTNAGSLLSILEHRVIWATNTRFLNDSSELKHGYEILRRTIDRMKGGLPNPLTRVFLSAMDRFSDPYDMGFEYYVACFCESGDLLSQWRGYGSSGGYAIGFKAQEINIAATQQETEVVNSITILKVEYDERAISQKMEEALRSFIRGIPEMDLDSPQAVEEILASSAEAVGVMVLHMLSAKNDSFYEEQEWRIVVMVDESESLPILKFRAGQMPIPYLEVKLRHRNDPNGLLPISSITIGPTVAIKTAEEGLDFLLRHEGYQFNATRSRIPLI